MKSDEGLEAVLMKRKEHLMGWKDMMKRSSKRLFMCCLSEFSDVAGTTYVTSFLTIFTYK